MPPMIPSAQGRGRGQGRGQLRGQGHGYGGSGMGGEEGMCINEWNIQSTLGISKSIIISNYRRLSLSRSRMDPLKHFEISVLRHIRCAELRKIPIEQPNFTNEHVI